MVDTYALRGRILLDGRLVDGAVVVEDGRIAEVTRTPRSGQLPAAVIDAAIVAPGLIDLQVNGGFGVEVGDDPAAIRQLAARLPETGVTAFLPTVITSPAASYPRAFAAFAAARNVPGARPLGLHLEGPFLAPTRHGAHRRDLIEAADPRLLDEFVTSDAVRLVTLAPDRPGADERIRRLRDRGVVVSLGHTDATDEQFVAAVDAGATKATHLYNAMSPFGHRAPGAVGAALLDDRITVGLIVDGVHVHPAGVRLALRAKGPDRIALVTDMMSAAGYPGGVMPAGAYELGGRRVSVEGGAARLDDGTLAGSIITLDATIRNVVAWTDTTPADALRMATEVPARLLGLELAGRIAPGNDADLVLLGADLTVEATIVAAQTVYRREGT